MSSLLNDKKHLKYSVLRPGARKTFWSFVCFDCICISYTNVNVFEVSYVTNKLFTIQFRSKCCLPCSKAPLFLKNSKARLFVASQKKAVLKKTILLF